MSFSQRFPPDSNWLQDHVEPVFELEDLALQPGDVVFQDVDVPFQGVDVPQDVDIPLDDKERLELEIFFAEDE